MARLRSAQRSHEPAGPARGQQGQQGQQGQPHGARVASYGTTKRWHYQDGAFSMLPGGGGGLAHAASAFAADAATAAAAAAAAVAAAAAGAVTTEPATDVCAADASLPAPA